MGKRAGVRSMQAEDAEMPTTISDSDNNMTCTTTAPPTAGRRAAFVLPPPPTGIPAGQQGMLDKMMVVAETIVGFEVGAWCSDGDGIVIVYERGEAAAAAVRGAHGAAVYAGEGCRCATLTVVDLCFVAAGCAYDEGTVPYGDTFDYSEHGLAVIAAGRVALAAGGLY